MSGTHAGEAPAATVRRITASTDKTAALIVFAALGFLVAIRSGFRGALGD